MIVRSWIRSEEFMMPLDHIAVLYESHMPAVLVEAGMIVNRAEEQMLSSATRRANCRQSGRYSSGAILRRAVTNLMT
jgi:hypothetical protein